MKLRAVLLPFLLTQLAYCSLAANANSITLEQVTKDVTVLASDSMGGRASFTPEIDKAADYIAQRFEQIGLTPLKGQTSFKQTFELFQTKMKSISFTLDGDNVASSNLLLFSKHRSIDWTSKDKISAIFIDESQDFRTAMRKINQEQQNLVVFVHEKHHPIFNRYKNHFDKGSLGFKVDSGFSAVLVLTPKNKVGRWSVNASSRVETKTLTNVVGVLRGNKKKSESILFSSHYDHLGIKDGKNKGEDIIFNGADDNASGTTAVINLAQYFSNRKNNQRSLVFAAFTAEEIGGYGSKYFSETIDSDKIAAMINIEMIGKESKFGPGEFWMTGADKSNLIDILNRSLASKVSKNGINKTVHVDPYPKQNLFYRSDNATLAKLGVPAHSFSSSQIDKDQHYHQATDDLASLNLTSMHQVIQSLAESVETLVEGSQTPSRVDTSKINANGSFY